MMYLMTIDPISSISIVSNIVRCKELKDCSCDFERWVGLEARDVLYGLSVGADDADGR